MAAIALTIIILLNYLAFYYAYGVFEGSVGTKKKRFFSRKKSRRCAPGGGALGLSTVQTLQRIFFCRWFLVVDKLSHDSTEKMTTYPMYHEK